MDHCEIPRWQRIKSQMNNLSFEAFCALYQNDPSGICIDARTEEEYDGWHLPHAKNINYLSHNLADELEKLDKDKSYYVYCRTSRRSLRVCQLLKNMGFEKVYHLKDGIKCHII